MINTEKFGDFLLNDIGINFLTGVPCSYLKNFINYAYNSGIYFNAPNEGEALALASGAYVAGMKPAILIQNSGLGNMVNPLTSLNSVFKIPILIFVSWRKGEPGEQQHEVMGNITPRLIETLGFEYVILSQDAVKAKEQIDLAEIQMKVTKKPYFIIVEKDIFDTCELTATQTRIIEEKKNRLNPFVLRNWKKSVSREQILNKILTFDDNETIYIATTGKTGRELSLNDNERFFYMIGSMGLTSSFATGIALNTNKKVVVIDGDGSAAMRLSAIPMIGSLKPKKLLHIILDNNVHSSTGGQQTLSDFIDFVSISDVAGYSESAMISCSEVDKYLQSWHEDPGCNMLHINTTPDTPKKIPRPEKTPEEVKERLIKFLNYEKRK